MPIALIDRLQLVGIAAAVNLLRYLKPIEKPLRLAFRMKQAAFVERL